MRDYRFALSPYINGSLVKRRTNFLMEKIIRLFFMRMNFDEESLRTLADCSQKGKVVYASFQNSMTSLLILMNSLRKQDLSVPYVALDFRLYSLQIASNIFKRLYRFFSRIFKQLEYEPVGDQDFLGKVVADNQVIAFSLLSTRKFKRRYIETEADSIQYLVEIQKKTYAPIFILPQIIFWNRNPERTKALLTPSATGDRNILSAISVSLRSITPAFIRISSPINLKEEMEQFPGDDSREIARRIRNKLLEQYSFEKRSILGPLIKSRQEMMEKVLYHQNVLDCIEELKKSEGAGEKKLRGKAYGYFTEIAADFSILYINFFNKSVQYMFRKIFNGIQYDIDDFKMIREASQGGPLIFMPSHKSHMDYLIVSSLCYENKIIPPHIVAGSNLLFFPMGKIFRRSGAFFMRRSFKGLKLYGVIFRQYVKTLINEGYSIEFFIEGGRSRTGKMVLPKMGILKYLIESIEEGYNRDMVFVPLTINYDRILEETSYVGEIKGKEKKAETTSAFMKSRKLLKRKYGSVYLSFNEPISYQSLRKQFPGTEDPTPEMGDYLTKKINDVIMVTPFAIVSMALLLSVSRGFTRDIIRDRIRQLHDYFGGINAPMTTSLMELNYDEIIDYVISSYQSDDIVRELAVDDKNTGGSQFRDLFVVNEDSRARINFYKNGIIHYMLPLTFVSISILATLEKKNASRTKIMKAYEELKDFFSSEFVYPSIMDETDRVITAVVDFLHGCGYLKKGADSVQVLGVDDIKFFSRSIQDILESYLIVFRAIAESHSKTSRRELTSDVRKHGITMYHLGEVTLPESLSMPNYQNAMAKAVQLGSIVEQRFGKKNIDIRVEDPDKAAAVIRRLKAYLDLLK